MKLDALKPKLSLYFSIIGAQGGKAKSKQKAEAAVANGAKGGRPRKKK